MVKRPLVLFLPRWYPEKDHPLHGIFIQRHAQAASEFSTVVVLYATADASLETHFFYHEIQSVNNVLEVLYYYKKRITGIDLIDRILKIFFYFLCMYKGYYKILELSGKPDLCHVNVLLRTGIFAYWLKKIKKIKFVYTEHWSGYHPEDGNYRGFRKLIYPFILSNAEWIMPVTTNLMNVMKARGIKGKFKQVANVVDTNLFKVSSNKSTAKITALHISNFDNKSKNITGLIEVVSIVSETRNDFRLNIVGNGDEAEQLKSYADKFGILNKTIFFLGTRFKNNLVTEIAESDFLVMFSNYENQPCVISEAMACGKPILATSVGGIPEMVNEQIGILSPVGNVAEMAKNFTKMLDNYPTYNPEFIRSVSVKTYGQSRVGKQFYDIYQDALQ